MFTGIVEEIGSISSFKKSGNGAVIDIKCCTILEDIHIGDSISVNGVCQTVVSFSQNSFRAYLSEETLRTTKFKDSKVGDFVNLERAMKLNSRFGGHIVSGHVESIGKLVKIEKFSEFYNIEISLNSEILKYVVHKGSITVDGISLTIARVFENFVNIAVIPHTYENTALKTLKVGDFVNIETDILAKYVESVLSLNRKETISLKMLEENGFV